MNDSTVVAVIIIGCGMLGAITLGFLFGWTLGLKAGAEEALSALQEKNRLRSRPVPGYNGEVKPGASI